MAYNVTNDEVKKTQDDLSEKMLDKHSDQDVSGIKIFTDGVVAQSFALADGTPLKPAAVESITNNKQGALLISNGDNTVTAAANLSHEKGILLGGHAIFTTIEASAKKLRDIPSAQLQGKLPLELVDFHAGGALGAENNELTIDFENVSFINMLGQTLSDDDTMIVYDTSHSSLRKATLKNFYNTYINSKIHHPGGGKNSLQFKKGAGFGGSASLTFDDTKKTLGVQGDIQTFSVTTSKDATVNGTLVCNGAITQAITTVTNDYTVQDGDYTILADTTHNKVCLTLPNAASHAGRVLNIKMIHSSKYSLKTGPLTIDCVDGQLDYFDDIVLKMARSSRTLQSDGTNWWVINGRGS
jgi:hypothetical protein